MLYIDYWFIDDESGEEFFVEVKANSETGDVYTDAEAWRIAKDNFGEEVRLKDIISSDLAEEIGLDTY